MRFSLYLGILSTLVVTAVSGKPLTERGSDAETKHVLHEERSIKGRGLWTKTRRLHSAAVLPMRIGLTQQNLHRAEEFMQQVSHPASPDYGKHWSPSKIVETFAPRQETLDAVMAWLDEEGITTDRRRLSQGRNWVSFNATVEEAERLLKTEYHYFQHSVHGHSHVAVDRYHIPEHLAEHVDFVTPTVHFDSRVGSSRVNNKVPLSEDQHVELRKRFEVEMQEREEHLAKLQLVKRKKGAPSLMGDPDSGFAPKQGKTIENALISINNCDQMITPACLRALYQLPFSETAFGNNTLGIVEYTPQAYLQEDLDMFFGEFETRLKGRGPLVELLDNGIVQTKNRSFGFNGESGLDLQYAMALIYPQNATLYQVGDLAQSASFNNFLDSIDSGYCDQLSPDPNVDAQYAPQVGCGTSSPTNVISTSYGYNEGDLSLKYETRQCMEYMKLGLRGVSLLFSSGDSGVAGNGGQCIDPQTGAYNQGKSGVFNPSFPGSCPWVTAVGATQILNGSSVRGAESACERVILSGGGFSNFFKMPSYQEKTLKTYFSDTPPPYSSERFNSSRNARGFPDVSANGAFYVTAVNGKFTLSFGTSASAPVFGAVLTLLNEKRLAAGKGPVGFVNPVLYEHPEVMNDIQNGKNPGCGTNGFDAVKGWDPVTGLGTPNYPKMEELFMGLP